MDEDPVDDKRLLPPPSAPSFAAPPLHGALFFPSTPFWPTWLYTVAFGCVVLLFAILFTLAQDFPLPFTTALLFVLGAVAVAGVVLVRAAAQRATLEWERERENGTWGMGVFLFTSGDIKLHLPGFFLIDLPIDGASFTRADVIDTCGVSLSGRTFSWRTLALRVHYRSVHAPEEVTCTIPQRLLLESVFTVAEALNNSKVNLPTV